MAGQVINERSPLLFTGVALAALLFLAVFFAPLAPAFAAPAGQGAIPVPAKAVTVPVKGMVTVVDLGAESCIPCRMMVPVLEDVRSAYKGRAAVVFIDVREHQDQATSLRIRAIPTQIFYDKKGREVARHEGFMDKQTLSSKIDALLKK